MSISQQLRRASKIRVAQDEPGADARAVPALNKFVASATVLAQKTRKFHWYVTGQNFFDLHQFFGEVYGALVTDIDDFAERVRQLQKFPVADLSAMLKGSAIQEAEQVGDDMAMANALLEDLGTLEGLLKEIIQAAGDDRPTVFLADTVAGRYEKWRWFLRAFAK